MNSGPYRPDLERGEPVLQNCASGNYNMAVGISVVPSDRLEVAKELEKLAGFLRGGWTSNAVLEAFTVYVETRLRLFRDENFSGSEPLPERTPDRTEGP